MKVVVFGLWHLGSVTAACLADAGFDVIGVDPGAEVIANLGRGMPPLFEPGLAELVTAGVASGKLTFTTDVAAVAAADLVWVTFDTPVDDDDRADVGYVKNQVRQLFPILTDGTVVLVSSQLPVGSIAELESDFAEVAGGRHVTFACSPENLRLGKAISVFRQPERIVVGLRGDDGCARIAALLAPFCETILWIRTESAEMTKHALNAFLATSVTFINEVATVCERVGADASEVEAALRSEPRIGHSAYIRPGAAFAGGTLARDVTFLGEMAATHGLDLPMIGGINPSNRYHRGWPLRQLRLRLGDLAGRTIAVLGLSYKSGTNAIRRSAAIELCRGLMAAGAAVQAFDPVVTAVTSDLTGWIRLAATVGDALIGAEALVLMTEWPEFKALTADQIIARMARPLVLDQNRFLSGLAEAPNLNYATIGKPL